MKKFLKISFRVLLLLIVVVIVGLVIFINTFDINSFKQEIITETKKATGGDLVINGNMDLRLSLNPYFEINNVSFRNPEFPTSQDLVRVQKASVVISVVPLLYKTIAIKEIILDSPSVYLTKNPAGRNNWDLSLAKTGTATVSSVQTNSEQSAQSGSSAGVSGYAIELGKVSGNNIKIAYADEVAKSYYNLDVKSIALTPTGNEVDIDVQANFNNIPVAIKGTSSGVMDILSSKQIKLDIGALALDTRVGISGSTDTGFKNFSFKVKGHSPEATSLPNAIGMKMDKMGEFKMDGSVKGASNALNIVLDNLSIGNNQVSGDIAIATAYEPNIRFNLHSPMVHMVSAPPAETAKTGQSTQVSQPQPPSTSGSDKLFSSEPLPFEFLQTGVIKGVIAIDKLVWGKHDTPVTTALNMGVDLEGGVLRAVAKSATGTGTGTGTAEAQMILDARQSNMAKLSLQSKMAIPSSSVFLPNTDYIKGMPLNLDVTASSFGGSVASLMSNLDGNIYLVVKEGIIHKDAISWMTGDILTKLVTMVMPHVDDNKEIAFQCGAANIDIKKGMVNLEKTFAIQTDKFNAMTEGDINLGNERLDIMFDFSSLKGAGVGVSDILSSLFEINGTLAHPEIGMGVDQLAGTAARVGAALLTGGLSMLGEKAADIVIEDANPCQTAWNKGERVQSAITSEVKKEAATQADNRVNNAVSKAAEQGKKALDSAIQSLKGLF